MAGRATEEAAKQDGPVVCRVFCQRCIDGEPGRHAKVLATVRRVDRGLYYEAEFITNSTREVTRTRTRLVREQSGQHYPDATREVQALLLDLPSELPQDWPPRAQCPVHGDDEMRHQALLDAIRGPSKAARVTIHR